MKEYKPILWIVSLGALIAAHFFWTLHDWYFWDPITKQYVINIFRDWHYIKLAWIALFIISVYLVPSNWYFILGWLAFRWSTWEIWCYHASMSEPYKPGFLFGLSLSVAILISVLAAVLPIFMRRFDKMPAI